MIQAKTYYCGRAGGVRKLVDLVGSWIDVSLPANGIPDAFGSELFDIEVDPNNGDKVFVVGELNNECGFNWWGIGVSSDGGVTWQIPGGNYTLVVDSAFCYHKWIEVSVVDSNVIYACGIVNTNTGKGTVVKSINGGLTFNQCGALPNIVNGLDVNSIHFTSPLIGVIGLNNYICKTIDGGNTWTVLNGGNPLSTSIPVAGTPLNIGPITGIRIKSDQSSIVAIGLDYVFETIPAFPINSAGMAVDSWEKNAYPPVGFIVPVGVHLSYLNPLVAGENWISVSGVSSLGMESGNNGSGWNFGVAPGYDNTGNGFNRIAAHFYKLNLTNNGQVGFYNKNNDLYSAGYGFNPSFELFSDNSPFGINAVWTWYQETPAPICYRVTDCNGNFFVTNTDLSSFILPPTTYFNIVGYAGCFTASLNSDCSGAISIVVGSGRYIDCAACNPPPPVCYELVDCSSSFPPIKTTTDLSGYLGKTITLDDFPGICWEVIQPMDCTGSIPLTSNIISNFLDCPSCLQKCYVLTDCTGMTLPIITNTDLALYVNKVIKIGGCNNTCYIVTNSSTCTNSIVVVLNNNYATCELCNPLVPVIIPPLKTRKIQPNYVSEHCSLDIIEKVNCEFAQQVYNKVIQAKYGINICKEDEFDRYLIKKQLLDLNLMYDPSVCSIITAPIACDPIVIIPPVPVPCSDPINLVVSMTSLPISTCMPPIIRNVEIVYQTP